MKRTKYLLPFFLIALICIISFRFFFFETYIHFQKRDFRRQLFLSGSKELVCFEFSKTELFKDGNRFEWKKQNKELVVEGVYHEVIKVAIKQDKALVFAIPDKAENILFQSYFCLQKDLDDTSPKLLKLLLNLTYIEPHFRFSPNHQLSHLKQNFHQEVFLSNHFRLKIIKPPEPVIFA